MKMESIGKAVPEIMVGLIEYVEGSDEGTLSTDLRRTLTVKALAEVASNDTTFPLDVYLQIIEGKAEVMINGISTLLKTGQGVVMPVNESNCIVPNGGFKMLVSVLKLGYT